MASPLVQASLSSPGFLGLNSEQQSAATQERFASQLDNAVFDEGGKLQARKGFDKKASGSNPVKRLFWWRKDRDIAKLMAVADSTLYEMTSTTTEFDTFTSRGTTNSDDVALVNINGQLAIIEQGQTPKVWDGTGTAAAFAAATGSTANPTGGVAISAFGRLFVTSADGTVVHGSELQPDPKTTGITWDDWFIDITGNSGATAVDGWTYGADFITALGAYGDMLVVFGKESVLVLSDISGDPAVVDSITGVGCVNQHTVVNTGDDLLFLSNNGVQSLNRLLRKETPSLSDVSSYVRSELVDNLTFSNADAVYSPLDGFYLISDGTRTYMFDMRQILPGGARRASSWSLALTYSTYDAENNRLFLAVGNDIGVYNDYNDDTDSYKFTLKSSWLDLGRPNIKILKKLGGIIFDGESYTPKFSVAFDWDDSTEEQIFAESLPSIRGAEWGASAAEWGLSEWGGSTAGTFTRYVQASGSGQYVRYGVEFVVDGQEVGIHEIRMFAKLGKLSHV